MQTFFVVFEQVISGILNLWQVNLNMSLKSIGSKFNTLHIVTFIVPGNSSRKIFVEKIAAIIKLIAAWRLVHKNCSKTRHFELMKIKSRKIIIPVIAILISLNYLQTGLSYGTQNGQSVIWGDPGEVEKLDFTGGAGGRDKAPKPPFAFIEENLSGTNPKVRIIDATGVKWSVKFGSEVNAEVFATRIAWASGYYVEPAYFIPSGKIDDLGELTRARNYIKPDGSFTNARFERQRDKGVKKLEAENSWSWVQNPFLGSKELNGLKIIMMLVSNWDNKDLRDVKRGSNTAIEQIPTSNGTHDRFIVSDWGGSMGKWGGVISREKWDCKGYTQQTPAFVKGIRGDYFVWGYSGQHTKDFSEGIPIGDVRWLLGYLGRITDDQLREGLRSSGASSEEVECFTRAIRERINQMKSCVGE